MLEYTTEQISKDYLHLNSCGIQNLWDRNYLRVRERGRVDYHIIYIIQGRCTVESAGQEVILNCGDMVLFLPGEKQKYAFEAADKSISAYLHFSGTGCDKLLSDIGFLKERVLRLGKSHTITALFEKTTDEFSYKKPFFNENCIAYLINILSEAGRRNVYNANPLYRKNSVEINAALKEMLREYPNHHPIEYYANYCFLSTSRFYRVFKAGVGVTPVEYINCLRVNQAKELLINTNMSISEIAETVGFTDQNYFGRVFKRITGASPKKFQIESDIGNRRCERFSVNSDFL